MNEMRPTRFRREGTHHGFPLGGLAAGGDSSARIPEIAPAREKEVPGPEEDIAKSEPAYVRECVAGWHVHNGRGELCFTFAKSYDACRLHGRLLILCKKFPGGVDVVEFCWDAMAAAFIEHRRYTDEAPYCDDIA